MAEKKKNDKKSNTKKKKNVTSKNGQKKATNIKTKSGTKKKTGTNKKNSPKKVTANKSMNKTTAKKGSVTPSKSKNANKDINTKIVSKNGTSKLNKKKYDNTKKIKVEIKNIDLKKIIKFPTLSDKNRKKFIVCSVICLILAIILLIPYGVTNYQSGASGKILDVPKFSKLSEECCMYSATFKSPRSYSVLKVELENIFDTYKKMNCDGKEYFYNEKEDYTITEYGLKRGFVFNSFYITYGPGNSCEIDTTLKNIEMLPDNYSLADAKKDGNYVIDGEEVFNIKSYEQFLNDVEQNIPSTLRIVTNTKEGDLIITDLKYLSDGKYKVVYDGTRDRTNKEDDRVIMAYKYEHIGIYKNKLYAYNGKKITKSMLKTDDVYYLFDIEKLED